MIKVNTDSLYDGIIEVYSTAIERKINNIIVQLETKKDVNVILLQDFLSLLNELIETYKVNIEIEVIDNAGIFKQ